MNLLARVWRWTPRLACGAAMLSVTAFASAGSHDRCTTCAPGAMPHVGSALCPPDVHPQPAPPHAPEWPPVAPPTDSGTPTPVDPGMPDATTPDLPDPSVTPDTTTPDATTPDTMQGNNLPEPMTNFDQGLAANTGQGFDLGLGGGGQDVAFNQVPMIGDNFGGTHSALNPFAFAIPPIGSATAPGLGTGGGGGAGANVGIVKQAENASPIPTDRVFVNYSLFNQVPLVPAAIDVHRITAGVEKTFLDGLASVEFKVPFAGTLSDEYDIASTGVADDWIVGNATITPKFLLYQDDALTVSAGVGVLVPTAEDLVVFDGGAPLLTSRNEAVHLMPFIGGVYTPNDTLFVNGLAQLDIDVNGNGIEIQGAPAGDLRDPTFLYLSAGVGLNLFQNDGPGAGLRGVIPTAEIHLNQSLDGTNTVLGPATGLPLDVTAGRNITQVNAVFGTHFLLGDSAMLTTAYTVPLNNDGNQQFDGEFRLMLNFFFGGSSGESFLGL